jgi:hypothetical protein
MEEGEDLSLCQYSKAQNMVWALHTNGLKEVLFKKVIMANNLALIMWFRVWWELLKMLMLKKYDCQTQIKTVCAKNLLGYV